MNLNALPKKEITQKLKKFIDNDSWHVLITLIAGDLLIGGFFPEWIQKSEENKDKIWFPKCSERQPEKFRFGLILESSFKIVFNSPKGTINGDANIIDVPLEKIADIKKLEWENPEIKEKGLKNISNPLAVIINKCNSRAAEKNSLEVLPYCEMALAREEVGDEGISFNNDELIYIDIDYFNNCQSTFDAGPVSFGSSIGAYQLAHAKLQNSVIQRGLRTISRCIVEPLNFIGTVQQLNQEITTTLQGDDCVVVLSKIEDAFLPIFLKKNSLLYPLEYIDLIKSKLIFHGELKQIPISVENVRYDQILFARAIGFIKSKCL